VVAACTGPLDWLPLAGLVPDHPPEAVQWEELAADQLSVVLPPAATVLGFALIWIVGALAEMDTVTDWVADPPSPVQASVKVEPVLIGPLDCEPFGLRLPDQAPEAEQRVASTLDQVSVELPPGTTVLGLALSLISGAKLVTVTIADWVLEPPGPMQLKLKSEVFDSAPVDQVPLVATEPLQPPLAVQPWAFSVVQVSVEPSPALMVVGDALSVMVGAGWVTCTSADCDAEPPLPVQCNV
jgi:hypothetical protein